MLLEGNVSFALLNLVSWLLLAEKAFGDDGNLKQPKELSINKVGHGMLSRHCISNQFHMNRLQLWIGDI